MKFEKAGAGLPEFERLFIKLFLVPIVRITMNWTISRLQYIKKNNLLLTKYTKWSIINLTNYDKVKS